MIATAKIAEQLGSVAYQFRPSRARSAAE